jgi:hypothetical protein
MARNNKPNEMPPTSELFVEAGQPHRPAKTHSNEELTALLHGNSSDIPLGLLKNLEIGEHEILNLLARKELPRDIVEEISKRRDWLKLYAVKKSLACHPHVPRLVGLRLLRELYLMDLVQIALTPAVSAELKGNSEDQLAARLPQLPLGQKITLARRGPARIAGLLLAEGHPQVIGVALDNPRLASAQILKALAKEGLAESVVQAIAQHRKWASEYNVRLALVRNPATTLSTVLSYLPQLTAPDLQQLAAPGIVPDRLRKYLEAETRRRLHAEKRGANGDI